MGHELATAGRLLLVGAAEAAPELQAALREKGWEQRRLDSPAGVLRQLHHESDTDVVVLVPDSDLRAYTELCRHIKFDTRTTFVPVIFALPPALAGRRAEVFAAGADDCIQLPAPPVEVILRLSNAQRIKRATDSLEDAAAVVSSLANAIEGRDVYTRGHVERVAAYAVEIGRRLNLPDDDLAALRTGGVVHDIGKVAVPDHLLNKPGRLSDEEMAIVRRHPVIGYDILLPLRTFRRVLPIVRWHHERPNGTGYPDGLAGSQLPLLARIVALADVFDALSTARCYRPALAPEEYRRILVESGNRGDLDPALVATLLGILDESAVALVDALAPPDRAAPVPDV